MTTTLAYFSSTAVRRVTSARRPAVARHAVVVREEDLAEVLEDERLNAIADERADGPFIRVSLDDL
ncbi:hypothetical protein [Pararhodobacter aggregans]